MSTSEISTTDFTVRLHDGRTVGVASVGRSDGFPIFHCHGSGSSRLEVMNPMTLRQGLVPVITHRSESIQIDYRTRQEAP